MLNLHPHDLLSITFQRKRMTFSLAFLFAIVLLLGALCLGMPLQAHAQGLATHKPTAQPVQLANLKMISPNNGWALSGDNTRVFHTKNGPAHWTDVTPTGFTFTSDNTMNSITSSFFLDAQHGYLGIMQDSITSLLSTHDGGHSWQAVPFNIDSLTYTPIYQISFIDARHGWLSIDIDHGFGHYMVGLMHTSDGGKTWQKVLDTTLNPAGLPIKGIKFFSFTSQKDGWMSGPENDPGVRLYVTHDGGATWTLANISAITIPDTAFTVSYGPFFSDARQATVVVTSGVLTGNSTYLTTYHTSDGGKTWQANKSIAAANTTAFRQIAFTNASHGWVLGLNVKGQPLLEHTTDGGQHWTAFLPSPSGLQPFTEVISDMTFLNTRDGWIIDKTDDHTETLFQTHDGGASWHVVNPTAVKP